MLCKGVKQNSGGTLTPAPRDRAMTGQAEGQSPGKEVWGARLAGFLAGLRVMFLW